jgi:hypothetical protein
MKEFTRHGKKAYGGRRYANQQAAARHPVMTKEENLKKQPVKGNL